MKNKAKTIKKKSIKPSKKLQQIKKFLTTNKIFFDTVVAISLSLTALFISVAQLWTATQQNSLIKLQAEIERQQVSPHFVIQVRQFHNDEMAVVTDDKILIFNEGNVAYNIEVRSKVFFNLKLTNRIDYQSKEASVPITGYYFATYRTGENKGLVKTIEGISNNLKRHELEKELDILANEDGAFIDLEIKRYVKLTYRDIFNESHTLYYEVPLLYGGNLIEAREGESVFENDRAIDSEEINFDIDRVTAQQLYDLFR